MLFEETEPGREIASRGMRSRRVWDGLVRGNHEYWVVVAREGEDMAEWLRPDEKGLESTPLRVCRAILDDDVLVLGEDDFDYELPYDDYLGTI